jgi:hypothetical protein
MRLAAMWLATLLLVTAIIFGLVAITVDGPDELAMLGRALGAKAGQ